MTKKHAAQILAGLTLTSVLFACTSSPQKNDADHRTPASVKNPELNAEEIQRYQDAAKTKNTVSLRGLLDGEYRAQILVTAFDARIESAKELGKMDALMNSHLYCKINNLRYLHEKNEAKFVVLAKQAYESGADTKAWMFHQISTFAKENRAKEAGVMQALRLLVSEEETICGAANCVADEVKNLDGLSIAPLDNTAFNQFMKKNRTLISAQAQVTAQDLKPGACFEAEKRKPNQSSGYDWKNRTWVGTMLPAGQFVFTYDDGPHDTFTRQIRDTWAQAGMAKPAFFWVARNVATKQDIVRELNSQGYTIGSHSERHADLGNLAKATSPADFNAVNKSIFGPELSPMPAQGFDAWKNQTLDREINKAVADLGAVIGKPVRYYRLPYGSGVRNDLIGARFQALNLDNFFWRVDSLDWQDKNPESIRDRVVTQMKTVKSGIILFHDVHPQSAAAAKLMVDVLKNTPDWKAIPLESLPGLHPTAPQN